MKKSILSTFIILLFTVVSHGQEFVTTWTPVTLDYIEFDAVTTGPVSYTWQTIASTTPASGSGTFTGPNVTISGLPQGESIILKIQPTNFKRFISVQQYQVFSFFRMDSVEEWGSVEWESMENAFKYNSELQVNATDFPDLSNVTSLANMFIGCSQLNSPFNINYWDISTITNISGMFKRCYNFNQALSQWDTSNVTDMSSLFEIATAFNQNIGNWDTANVTNMRKMFKGAFFNRNIGNWNTASVTNMSEMFSYGNSSGSPSSFNKDISSWNTANVTNMSGMFCGAEFFNRNIGNWNTSNVTDMSKMFKEAKSFNQNLGNWDISNVTDMSAMFSNNSGNYLFNNAGSSSIETWDTSNVVDMSSMFSGATNFNHNLGNWSLLEIQDLTNMLDNSGLDCENYSMTLIGWNNNPDTPNNIILGATFLEYRPDAITAVDNLVLNKGWGFSGHDLLSTLPSFNINNTYCEGESISPLPTVSTEGVTGTWSPAINNTTTTTYTFTPDQGECALPTNVILFINNNTIPTFTQVAPICEGESLSPLPTTSNNGISGTWSPALNNTTTTTYTFTPNQGECATNTTLTITVNQSATTPTFTQIPSICEGETLSPLPSTSNNGISGTWSPAINNTATTTYTFTPSGGQCASTTTLTITVTPNATPTFTQVTPICEGESLSALPTTSNNGISGNWTPAINNTATTTYTFTPNSGQCATTTTLTITVIPNATPTFTQVATICEGESLSSLPTTSNNGISGTWSPAINNTTTTTYTFTPNSGQCASTTTLTITVIPNATPTFTQFTPICEGESLSPLPTTSNNGIVGTWSPAINNMATTTYTFTPNSGQCATTATLTITVNPSITPTFSEVSSICEGESLSPLPTTSNNGISGTWSPAINNTATTTYTFTPNSGQCATTTTLTITVNNIDNPTGASTQTLSNGDTISDIDINPTTVIWYATLEDALTNTNPLQSDFPLENNSSYFAVNDDGECRSEPFEVLIELTLSVNEGDFTNLKHYPNPVSSNLYISNNVPIKQVEVYNLIGQQLIKKSYNKTKLSLDLSTLSEAIYLIKINTLNQSNMFKIIKQ